MLWSDDERNARRSASYRYSLQMRVLHWVRAILILGLIALGLVMTSLPDSILARFDMLYPLHKEFGVLAFCVGAVALFVRRGSALPPHPSGLARWEVARLHCRPWCSTRCSHWW